MRMKTCSHSGRGQAEGPTQSSTFHHPICLWSHDATQDIFDDRGFIQYLSKAQFKGVFLICFLDVEWWKSPPKVALPKLTAGETLLFIVLLLGISEVQDHRQKETTGGNRLN